MMFCEGSIYIMNSIVRIGVFYDGHYFYSVSNYYAYQHERAARISVAGLHDIIRSLVAEREGVEVSQTCLSEAHYFRNRISAAQAEKHGKLASERGFEDILVSQGVTLHYQMHRGPAESTRSKGALGIALGAELLDRALGGHFDVAVLVLGDPDFVPLFRKMNSMGIRTMVLGWAPDPATGGANDLFFGGELHHEATYPVDMIEFVEAEIAAGSDHAEGLFVKKEEAEAEARREAPDYSHLPLIQGTLMTIKDGFGFIEKEPNNVFFHASDLIDTEFSELTTGDLLEYRLLEGGGREGGDIAHDVRSYAPSEGD